MVTKIEFCIAIFFMFVGVLFYSNILTELLIIVNTKLKEQEYISEKTYLLKTLKKELKIPNQMFRDMVREIIRSKNQNNEGLLVTFRPNLKRVIAKDAEELLYQAYQNEFPGFEKIRLFNENNKKFMIDFAENMT